MEDNFTFTGNFSTPAVAAVLSVETVAGLVANFIILSITLYQRKSLKQPSTIFFTSLILALLVLLLVYLPLSIIAIAAEEWIFGSSFEEKSATCSFAAYIFWYCLMVITLTLDAISFDRFLFIVKPRLHKRFMRPWFMNEQSLSTTPDAYTSQKKRLFGIFGSMLIVYGICFTPGTIMIILIPIVDSPAELFVTSYVCILFITVANPIVQSYFRPEIKTVGEWIFGSTDEEKRGTCAFAAFIVCYTVLVQSFTLAAISFDRFLFIVKPHLHKRFMRPWVALTLTIAIWILSALFGSTPFYGLGKFAYLPNVGTCSPAFTEYFFVGYSAAIEVAVFLFIIITSVWTFCFTYKFIRDQSAIGEESVYLSRKKRLVGIFGAMLLVYVICLLPIFTVAILFPVVDISSHVVASVVFVLHLFTVINPLVQSYFRPGFKDLILTVVMKWPKRRLTNAMLRLNRMPNQSN
ncbi:PREDICTED: galanin receptor type 2-like [Amphimedon queenslandica]|uniref:G-protein coupled receptors family 1 profile domain-containing protein n=1 Tax=Amphimedon queenslandica TaxID=400682 RepID=A0AAN0JLQ0_AMPQE|nr:PREDICTED: galanin receptor type 2-like [Amphimedon queenslandica]|eukprot:XP_019857745.1 PREDICTED: galanin receptor type 2-like [Amphimedon queenslandica]